MATTSSPDPGESEDDFSDDSFLRGVAAAPDRPLAQPDEDLTGSRVGKYEILGKLGGGGMGIVYRARDERLARDVALKVLRAGPGRTEEQNRRFAREAKAASAIRHDNIATVYEVGEDGDQTFLALELVPGETLRKRLASGAMPPKESIRVALEIARALEAAHARCIVHRDLKPDNVMIEPNGAVKVLDFGLARWVPKDGEHPPESKALTAEGIILGTPGYMSPEQANGDAAEAPADIFALGVVLYEMLTGERPFRGNTRMETILATNRDPTPTALEHARDVPPALAKLVADMLEKDPTKRPATIAEVATRLSSIAAAKRGWVRPRYLIVAAIAAVAIAWLAYFKSAQPPSRDASPGPSSGPTASAVATPPSSLDLGAQPARSAAPSGPRSLRASGAVKLDP